tara:strand:+ start:1003 stop:1818 length:816 start_codon:yes stop_codon:yes gene_type:complete
MGLIFKEEGHAYSSTDPNEQINWTSVTALVGKFKEPFDTDAVAAKCIKNKKSKWYGLSSEDVKKIWKNENLRATSLGTFYHNQREEDLMSFDTITKEGIVLPIIPPIIQGDIKIAPTQKLLPGVYPEHFVYLKSAKICGQADYVEVVNSLINIMDYKTNKEIKSKGFKNWEGQIKKLLGPVAHVEDCNLQHYTLQMSIYMYIMLKHNPRLKPGKLTLQHVVFEKVEDDKYGYPVTAYSDIGDPIVKEIVIYEVPYMKQEVLDMINWLKDQE